jgi:predicted Zn-dependent protease
MKFQFILPIKFIFPSLLSFLLTIAFSISATGNNNLPDIGSSASQVLTLADEQMIGDAYIRQLRSLTPIMNDPEVNDYIQSLGFKLVENNPDAAYRRFQFFVMQENTVNAFALPGGYIVIHSGLINKTETESELASVLGHEIAHVTQRHLARRLELQKKMTIPSLAAFLATILIASRAKNGNAAMGALASSQSITQQLVINHTRSNETEADRMGILSLYDAGFDPNGAVHFFEKMQSNSRYESKRFPFLRTHPLSRKRITDARLRVSKYPKQTKIKNNERYLMIKEKIKALSVKMTPSFLLMAEQDFKKGKIKTDIQCYGYALLLFKANKIKKSEKLLYQLVKKQPQKAAYSIALAEVNQALGFEKRSIRMILSLLEQTPNYLPLIETLANLYLSNKQPKKARELLLMHIHRTLEAPYLLKLLAQAQEGSGHHSEVFETEGNYLLAMGDFMGARVQFYQALNVKTNDPYAKKRVNAQLSRIKEFLYKRR